MNHEIAPATDIEVYGQTEYWTIPTTRGDCEDYALSEAQAPDGAAAGLQAPC